MLHSAIAEAVARLMSNTAGMNQALAPLCQQYHAYSAALIPLCITVLIIVMTHIYTGPHTNADFRVRACIFVGV